MAITATTKGCFVPRPAVNLVYVKSTCKYKRRHYGIRGSDARTQHSASRKGG